MPRRRPFVIGVSVDGAGSHPAAALLAGATAALTVPERGGGALVALDDSFDPPAPGSPLPPFRFDALLSLARAAPTTTSIGLLATVTTTHTEPFHVSKNIAS